MDRVRVAFADPTRPGRSGELVLDDAGRVFIRVSPELASALDESVGRPETDLAPLEFDDHRRGLTLTASLAKGVRVGLLEPELVAGGLEVRAHLRGGRVRLTLRPGDFDPDAAWEFLVAANEAKLGTSHA